MIKQYWLGHLQTGQIVASISCETVDVEANKAHYEVFAWLQIDNELTRDQRLRSYVKDGSLAERPTFAVTDQTVKQGSTVSFPNIPPGASVTLNDLDLGVSDGSIELDAEELGDHVMKVSLFPYIDTSVTITVTE